MRATIRYHSFPAKARDNLFHERGVERTRSQSKLSGVQSQSLRPDLSFVINRNTADMFQSLIYSYLRRCPIDYGKRFVRKLARLPKGAEKIAFTSPDGIRYKLDLTNHVMREIFIFGQYEKNTARLLSRMAKEDSVYCDVGANIGAYVLPLSRKITKGKIFAFEPNPRALVILNENLSLNNAAGVEVIPCGLSDKKETLTLFTPSLTTASVHKNGSSAESVGENGP